LEPDIATKPPPYPLIQFGQDARCFTESKIAGRLVQACLNNYPPIPWFAIRGVSDFGDESKNDLFHRHASAAMASYAALYISSVLDQKNFWHSSNGKLIAE
jgi:hypothetical protein